jgi:outer membrane immunogenic protein
MSQSGEPSAFRDGVPKKGYKRMRKSIVTKLVVLLVLSVLSLEAMAQEVRSEVSVQGTGIFTKESNGQGVREKATDTGGVLAGYRYHINRWLSAEAVYGWNRNTQEFTSAAGFGRVQADVHQATGGLVVNVPVPRKLRVQPYVLAGGGALFFRPTFASGTIAGVDQQTVGTFAYGGGLDYSIPSLKKVALRVEYRGLVYKAPDFGLTALKSDTFTHTAEPSLGVVYHF